MANTPWYKQYDQLYEGVLLAKSKYENRCKALGAPFNKVFLEIRREFIARVVHESNWQEGIHLDEPRTQELTDIIFEKFQRIIGPHIELDGIAHSYRQSILADKKKGMLTEEIAAENLSFAHFMSDAIALELMLRQIAALNKENIRLRKRVIELKCRQGTDKPKQSMRTFDQCDSRWEESFGDFLEVPFYAPMTEPRATHGELIQEYMRLDTQELSRPMRIEYIHFFHKITMMGILPSTKRGVFRKTSVHVGDPDVFFPPPSVIPALMEEFCGNFPTQIDVAHGADVLKKAAEASYKFVRIHPYIDGNGRISRLLMNLVMAGRFPPVYLKADKKGRHRYAQALKRANRGNIEPLACLIAISLKEIYEKLLAAVSVL